MKFKQEKTQKGSRYTDWIRPIMKGYYMGCCDCGLVHKLKFRVGKVIKEYKDGSQRIRILPMGKYKIEMKVSRHDRLTKQERKFLSK